MAFVMETTIEDAFRFTQTTGHAFQRVTRMPFFSSLSSTSSRICKLVPPFPLPRVASAPPLRRSVQGYMFTPWSRWPHCELVCSLPKTASYSPAVQKSRVSSHDLDRYFVRTTITQFQAEISPMSAHEFTPSPQHLTLGSHRANCGPSGVSLAQLHVACQGSEVPGSVAQSIRIFPADQMLLSGIASVWRYFCTFHQCWIELHTIARGQNLRLGSLLPCSEIRLELC